MGNSKKPFRVVASAAVSVALVGVLALPAYASVSQVEQQQEVQYSQALSTNAMVDIVVPADAPTAALVPIAPAVNVSNSVVKTSPWVADVAPSEEAKKIVAAALAQQGVTQDCTDLVQNSLAKVGLTERRDEGGYDHGPWSLQGFGVPVTNGKWAPGDILGWPGYPHVALYVGNGMAVHGGMGGSTVLTSATAHFGSPVYVVRPA